MKKRTLALLLACVLLILPFAACQPIKNNAATDESTQATPSEPTTAPTSEPTTESTQKPTSEPTTDKPVDPPTPTASVFSGRTDTSWYTGDKKEYILTSADQLVGFHSLRSETCTFEGITIKLDCDVILNKGTMEEIIARGGGNHKWKQLNSNHQFRGVFDGQGHTISGLYMKLGASAVSGMFGGLGGNAEIKNFTLVNAYYGGPTKEKKVTLGAVAAKVHPGASITISNVSVTATMKEDTYKFSRMGGILGVVDAAATATLESCEFNGSISITGNYAGGMIGYVSNANAVITLKNCKNTGAITATEGAGGMIGSCTAKELNMTGCTNSGIITATTNQGDLIGENTVVMSDPTNGARPAVPAGKNALRVMSFNIQSSLPFENGVLSDAARNRIEAVRQEILFYAPDLIGFQEDTMTWHNNLDLSAYNRILNAAGGSSEMCAIYYKKELKLLDSGVMWLTTAPDNNGVALTIADLTTEGSKYKLSDADLAELGITKDSPESVLRERRQYNASTSYTLLGCRRMTWGIFDINGETVIYVNTHLQHRSPGSAYSTPAIQNIRNMERIKSFDILQQKLAELKKTYAGAVDFITGDFNDLEYTDIFNSATKDYGYSSSHLVAAEKYGIHGSWNNAFNLDMQGDNYPNKIEGTSSDYLDYCFVSKGIDVLKFRVGAGKAEITAVDGSKKTIYTSDHLPIITDLCF